MSLIQRLVACFVLVGLLIGLQGAASWWQNGRASEEASSAARAEALSTVVQRLRERTRQADLARRQVTEYVDPSRTDAGQRAFRNASEAIRDDLSVLAGTAPPDIARDVSLVGGSLTDWLAMIETSVAPRPTTAIPAPHRLDTALDALDAELDALARASSARVTAALDDARVRAARASRRSLALLGAALMLGGGFGVAVITSLRRQLGGDIAEVARVANAVATGDLTTPIETGRAVEGSVLAATARMQASLARTVTDVRAISEEISAGVELMASGSRSLKARTGEQATALEHTSATVEELDAAVKGTARTTIAANELTLQAIGTAETGRCRVDETVAKMGQINDSATTISDIVSVLDDIAFQTNILSLNAAVEASRAGEAGRGFAVVASEVRSLATRSAAYAKEIDTLIADSVEHIGQGHALADTAGRSMQEITEAVGGLTGLIDDVRRASEEQREGVSRMLEAMSTMDGATQQNALLASEGAESPEALREKVHRLAEAVSFFRLAACPFARRRPHRTIAFARSFG